MSTENKYQPKRSRAEQIAASQGKTLGQLLQEGVNAGKTQALIGQDLGGINKRTIRLWMQNENTELDSEQMRRRRSEATRASWQDPTIRATRLQGQLASYADPQRKADRLARSHSPQANARRTASRHETYNLYPERLKEIIKKAGATRKARKKEALHVLFKGDPKPILDDYFNTRKLSAKQIADLLTQQFGQEIRFTQVVNWLQTYKLFAKDGKEKLGWSSLKPANVELVKKAQGKGLIETLPMGRLWEIICLRYLSHASYNLETLGELFGGFTKEYMRQEETKALKILQKGLETKITAGK